MAVGTTTAILAAGTALSAGASIAASRKQAKVIGQQAEYNAQVYEQQAATIQAKKKIDDYQYLRDSARVRGAIVSRTAGKGLLLSGSPLAILADNESQMLFDKAISDYNLDVEKNYATSGASYYRTSGAAEARLAKYSGYSNAFSSILSGASNIGLMNFGARAGRI